MERVDRESLLKEEVYLICEMDFTIRQVAKKVGRSKSSVFLDITERLKNMDINLYNNVNNVLQKHKQIRHILGGKATKEKYKRIKK